MRPWRIQWIILRDRSHLNTTMCSLHIFVVFHPDRSCTNSWRQNLCGHHVWIATLTGFLTTWKASVFIVLCRRNRLSSSANARPVFLSSMRLILNGFYTHSDVTPDHVVMPCRRHHHHHPVWTVSLTNIRATCPQTEANRIHTCRGINSHKTKSKNNLGNLFCGTTDTAVLGFWVLKPEWAALFVLCGDIFLKFTSGVTPANLLVARLAPKSISSTYPRTSIGGAGSWDKHCTSRAVLTRLINVCFDSDSESESWF